MKINLPIYIIVFISTIAHSQTTLFYTGEGFLSSKSFAPVANTSDGGHLFHFSFKTDAARDDRMTIIKTDANLTPQWRKNFTWSVNGKRTLTFDDGSTILFARSNCWTIEDAEGQSLWHCPVFSLFKIDSNGESIWSKKFMASAEMPAILPI